MSEAIEAYSADVIERFWQKVARAAPEACWLWKAAKFGNGYGAFSLNGKLVRAHRVSYELAHGPIPTDHVIRHKCDNRPCCNPGHLESGTHLQNMDDRNSRGRQVRGERNPHAKLTLELVQAIRADPRGHVLVARDHGVARSLVQRIRQRKAWSHV